jgi:transcriptional regulator with XRE-family HTH domain
MPTSRVVTPGDSKPTSRPFRIYTPASLGAALKHYRQETGLTQAELAATAGLDRSYLSQLENGLETEHLRKLFSVIRALGLKLTLARENA